MDFARKLSNRNDPLEGNHEYVHDFIFQHLSGKDIIAASEVSMFWFNAIASSHICMKKILLNIQEYAFCRLSRLDLDILLNSCRKYENIFLRHINPNMANIKLKLFKKFAKSLRYIRTSRHVPTKGIRFARLEKLECETEWKDHSFSHATNSLKKLKIHCFENIDTLISCARINPKLEELSFDSCRCVLKFQNIEPLALREIKLKKLTVTIFWSTVSAQRNLMQFILMQADTMEELDIGCFREYYAPIINTLKKLKKLTIRTLDPWDDHEIGILQSNPSIIELFIDSAMSKEVMKIILQALSKLETLTLHGCTGLDTLELVIKTCPLLKQLNISKSRGRISEINIRA